MRSTIRSLQLIFSQGGASFIQTFQLHIPYIIASFLSSSLSLGAQPRSKIRGDHFICCLAQSYGFDTYGMTHYPMRELEEATLTQLRAVICGPDRILRNPLDDFVVPICQVDTKHGEERDRVSTRLSSATCSSHSPGA